MSANPTVVPKSAVQRLNDWVDKEEIVLKLNDSLVCRLKDGASWTLDTDKRAQASAATEREIGQLRQENTELKTRLMNAMESMEQLAREVADLKQIKTAAMDLLATERIRNKEMEEELEECRHELSESYRATVILKKAIETYRPKIQS